MRQPPSSDLLRDLVWEAELGRVLGAFSAGEVDILLLKGAAYRGREYALGERRARDADLLVKPEAFLKSQSLLKHLGYRVHVRGEAHATRPGPVPFDLDLHDRLYPDGDRGLWERSEGVSVGGGQGRILRPSDAFAYALWHGAVRHAQVNDRLREDLSRIARRGGTGFWDEVGAELARRNLRTVAAEVLPVLQREGLDIPAALLRPRSLPEARIIRWGLARGPRGGTGHLLMALASRDRWRGAGRLLRSAGRFLRGN
jgi:hypothetical protein